MTDQTQTEATDPKRAAYSAATTKLRDAYRDQFNELLKQEMAARGIEWAPRPTDAQKAEREVAELLAKFPELKVKFTDT
jgi:hypothetical protein